MKLDPSVAKSVNHFIRRHRFFTQQSLSQYTTSERRRFERDVYDFARAQGVPKPQAKAQTVKAREMCGEEEYDSENSALGDEVDDSQHILQRLSAPIVVKSTSSEVLPSIETKEAIDVSSEGHERASLVVTNMENTTNAGGHQVKTRTQKVEKGGGETGDGKLLETAETKLRKRKRTEGENDARASKHEVLSSRNETDEMVQESRHEVQDSTLDQHVSGFGERGNADLKAERRQKKRAKRQAKKDSVIAQQTLGINLHESREGDGKTEVIPPPIKGPNDPKSKAEAHQNSLRSNQLDPNEQGQTGDKPKKELREAETKYAALEADTRAARESANEHAIDLYNKGTYKKLNKQFSEEPKDMAAEHKTMREDKENVANPGSTSKKRKKSKPTASEKTPGDAVSTNKKRKPIVPAKTLGLAHSKSSDFQSPMIR